MKNMMKKLKALAALGMTMGLALGAQAADQIAPVWASAENEVCTDCLTFSADKPFGIVIQKGIKTQALAPEVNLEWSTDQKNWSEYKTMTFEDRESFKGYQAVQDDRDGLYKLYIRGTNNTQFASQSGNARYANKFTNTVNTVAGKIACSGNIETLLDWKTVAKGEHPKMDNYAFYYTFCSMTSLTTAPDLPAINLSTNCYHTMFQYCYSLTNAPAVLPATTLAQGCYQNMFKYSTSLAKAPKIAAMNQAKNACNGMFYGTALKVPPKLGATNIVENCYQSMLQKTQIELKTTGPGKPWMIPEAAKASAATAAKWSHNMFSNTTSEASLLMNIEAGKQYYVASATPVTLTVTAVEGASKVTVVDDGDEVSGSSPYTVYQDDDVSVTYTADDGYTFPGGKTTWTTNFTAGADAITVTVPKDQWPVPPPPVNIDVKAPEHATATVYKNKVDPANIVEKGGTVVSNSIAYAVYKVNTDKDWYFKGDVWVKAITNILDTTVNPAVDNNEIPDTIEVTCERAVLEEGQSTNLVAGTTYTAKPAPGKTGGVFFADDNTTLTGTNVTFEGNSADGGGAILNYGVATLTQATFKDNVAQENGGAINNGGILNLNDVAFENNMAHTGGAIVNGGTVNLLGPVSLKTTNDTFLNFGGLVNWDLTGETTGVLNGYENLINEYLTIKGTLQITVDDYEADTNEFVIATGDFTNIDNKKIFAITNSALDGETIQAEIGGCRVVANGYVYQLTSEEDLGAEPPTTNLVLTAIKFDMSHIIVDSTLPGSLKLGDDIPGRPGFFYGVNCFAEIPHDGTLEDTTTLEIAGGSASITNEVTLKAPANLILDDGAALSIMGEGSITNSLAAADSISGNGAIYLDKGLTDDQLKNYTDKLAAGSTLTIARASVTDGEAKTLVTESFYDIDAHDKAKSGEKTDTVITANLTADGIDAEKGLALHVTDAENLVAAGSITATAEETKPQTLKLIREEAATGDLTVNGKVSGFETITVANYSATGKMVTTSTLAANKDILISNDGHLDAKVMAGARLEINNTSANTLIGEYSGQRVAITNTAEGVAQDITLQACGTGMSAIALYGEAGSIYSNVVLVAGVNATPADLSANDGSGMITLMGTNTLSGSVRMKAGSVAGLTPVGVCMRFENADAIISAPISSALSTEIYGACNIASNDDDVATFNGGLTLKDGAVLGGKTHLKSTCAWDKFLLEGTVTLKDGAEVDRGSENFTIPAGATLKLQGSKIVADMFHQMGTMDIESGRNEIVAEILNATIRCTINLKGGELVSSDISNFGLLNWDLTAGTTTLDWEKVYSTGNGVLRATVGDVAAGTSYTLATNATTVTQTFTVTNSVVGGAAATVNAGGVCKAGGQFWALDVKDGNLTLTAIAPVKLTDVFLIDEEGKTNATAIVKIGDQTFEPGDDGSFEVPANYPLAVVYQATDDYMFGPGWKEKTVTLPEGTTGGAMPDELKQQVANQCQECWVDARDVALDTRERIVVGTPEDVLPIAYSTNNWGAVENAKRVRVLWKYDGVTYLAGETTESGYYDWMPELGYYGKYEYSQTWLDNTGTQLGVTNAYIYYSQPYALTWATPEHGAIAVTNEGAAVASGDNVLGYSLLKLTATPEARYEFTRWYAVTNDVQMQDAFEDPTALTQTFEMPNAETELYGFFQWKSNYTENVTVAAGEVWQIFPGETYQQGISAAEGSVIWVRGTVDPGMLTLAAGATNIWDFTSYGRPYFADFSVINAAAGSVSMIFFDETLTNGTYAIAGEADTADGLKFLISNGSSEKKCQIVVQDELERTPWVYVGAKRFKLYIDGSDNLQFKVEDGQFPVTVTAGPGGSARVIAGVEGGMAIVGSTVTVSATADENWQFASWSGNATFARATAATTTFTMPTEAACITAEFEVSAAYRAACEAEVVSNRVAAIAELNKLPLSDSEKAAYLADIEETADKALLTIRNAGTPARVGAAADAAAKSLVETVAEAEESAEGRVGAWDIGAEIGPAVKAELTDEGELVISGIGPMADFAVGDAAPWLKAGLASNIVEVTVSSNITYIGSYAFAGCANLETVDLTEVAEFNEPFFGTDVFVGTEGVVLKVATVAAYKALSQDESYLALDPKPAISAPPVPFEFLKTAYETTEGEALQVVVYGGKSDRSTAVTVNFIKGTYTSKPTAYLDGKRVTFPITLDFARGEIGAREITLITKTSKSCEEDRAFTLELGSPAANEVGETCVASVVVHDAVAPTEPTDTNAVRAIAWPFNGGTVSGAGTLKSETSKLTLRARAKSYATFAGWYLPMTNNVNLIDTNALVTTERNLKVGCGTEYGAGTYYAYFVDVLPVASVDDRETAATAKGVTYEDGVYCFKVGMYAELAIGLDDDSGKGSLTMRCLPSGLKYDKKTGLIYGTPTRACTKSVKVVAKNAAGKQTVYYTFYVEALPANAVGTWNGLVRSMADAEDGEHAGFGTVQFSATSAGRLSAKVTTRQTGTKSFSAANYTLVNENVYAIEMETKKGEVFSAKLYLTNDWKTAQLVGTVTGGAFEANAEEVWFNAIRSTCFEKKDKNQEALDFLEAYKGTYEATLYPENNASSGTVTFKVKDGGKVQVKAKGVHGTYSATCSGAFRALPDNAWFGGSALPAGSAAVQTAIRSSKRLWATDTVLGSDDTITGRACEYDAEGSDTHARVAE